MKFFEKVLLFCILLPFLVGCCPLDGGENVPYRVVVRADVIYENGQMALHRQFFQEESLRPILDYLRFVDPYGTPREDPEQLSERRFEITLTYSDGSQVRYQQRADRYFRMENGPWKCIDPQRGLYLSGIMGMMSGETPLQE